jgi:high-affinity nickel permease
MLERLKENKSSFYNSIISLSQSEKLTVVTIYSILAIASVISLVLTYFMGHIYAALGGLGIMSFVLGLRHRCGC